MLQSCFLKKSVFSEGLGLCYYASLQRKRKRSHFTQCAVLN